MSRSPQRVVEEERMLGQVAGTPMPDDTVVGALKVALVGGTDLHLQVTWENNQLSNVRKEVANILRDRGGVWDVVLDNGQRATIRSDAIACVTYMPGRGKGSF
jgi:hypothetical protein